MCTVASVNSVFCVYSVCTLCMPTAPCLLAIRHRAMQITKSIQPYIIELLQIGCVGLFVFEKKNILKSEADKQKNACAPQYYLQSRNI